MITYGGEKMSEKILGTEKMFKLFIRYCSLSVASMIFLGLNTIVDGIFVGNFIGPDALASVTIAMPVSNAFMAVAIAIGIGSQSVAGIGLGAGQKEIAQNMFRTALVLIIGISVLITSSILCFGEPIARFLGASDALLGLVMTYLTYLSLFLPPFGVMLVCDFMLKATGRPLYSMVTMVVAVLLNMVLNYVFIAKFGWGVKGAALATGCAYLVSCVMAMLPFFSRLHTLNFYTGKWRGPLAVRASYNGSSEGLTEIATGFTTLLFNITLMKFAGEVGVAAFSAINYLSFIGINILFGVSDGISAIISYNYGGKNLERIRQVLKLAGGAAAVIGSALFFIVYQYGVEFVSLFLGKGSPEVLDFAVGGAQLYAAAFLITGFNIIASGYFTAIGMPGRSALIAVSKGIVFVAIGMALWPRLFGINGIWLTVPLAELLTLLLTAYLIKRARVF